MHVPGSLSAGDFILSKKLMRGVGRQPLCR